jgi:hypothetical protein
MGPAEGAHRWVRRRGDFDTPGGGESSWLSFRVAWSGSTDKSFGLSPGRLIAAQRHPTSPIQFLPFWPSWPSPSPLRLPFFLSWLGRGNERGRRVGGGRGHVNFTVHRIAKRSLPNNRQAKLDPKRPREGGGNLSDRTGRPPRGKRSLTIPCHFGPAALRRQGAESLPPPPCCVSEQCFAPCALDNARCRELQCRPS